MNAALSQLVHHPWFWRGDDLAFVASTLPTGYEALDRELPGGGWPRGQLIELLADDQGIGELRLLLPALRIGRGRRPGGVRAAQLRRQYTPVVRTE